MDHSDAMEPEAKTEFTINTQPEQNSSDEAFVPPPPELHDSLEDSFYSNVDEYVRSRARRRSPSRRCSPPPPPPPPPLPVNHTPSTDTIMLSSSTALLSKVSNYDGVAELPHPSRSTIYLVTFPFTARDVNKWSWLITSGVEDVFVGSHNNGDPDTGTYIQVPCIVRESQPHPGHYWDPNATISNVYLSKALDSTIVTDEMEKEGVRYFIVVQKKETPDLIKLKIARSRKAAGIIIYYEALSGNSVVFVGAILGRGKLRGATLIKLGNAEAAAHLDQKEGAVGVIC